MKFPALALVAFTITALGPAYVARAADPSPEGLERVENARVALAYVRPGTDWRRFTNVQILELVVRPEVRDATPRGTRPRGRESFVLRDRDVADLKRIFDETMREELTQRGFAIVDEPNDNTLVLAAELTDIVLTAPIESSRRESSSRGRTYTSGAGSLAIRAVLAEGATRTVVAAAADRRYGRNFWGRNTRATNVSEARSAFRNWARTLSEALRARVGGAR